MHRGEETSLAAGQLGQPKLHILLPSARAELIPCTTSTLELQFEDPTSPQGGPPRPSSAP